MNKLSILAAFVLLSACGGSDKSHQAPPVQNQPPPPPMTTVDAFFAQVMQLFSASENSEPVALDGAAATVPENTEPGPVGP